MFGGSAWQLDWLTMDPYPDTRDVNGVQWIALKVENFWGSPKSDVGFTPMVGRHGVFRVPGYKRERVIPITGRAYCADDAALRAAEVRVAALLSDVDSEVPLICRSAIGNLACNVVLDGDVLTAPVDVVSEPGFEFSLQVAAPDPRKYALEVTPMQTGLPQQSTGGLDFVGLGHGLDFVSAGGLDFGPPPLSGSIDLRNTGTAPSLPVFTLHGPLTTPTLTTSDGSSLTYNGTLAAGDFVVIDTSVPSVLLGGTASRRHLVNPAQFRAFSIPPAALDGTPGMLRVSLSHGGSPTATGYVLAEFRSAWF